MVWLLVIALVLGIVLLIFGFIVALDPEGRGAGRSALCMATGIVLVLGALLRFAWVAWYGLARVS